MSYVFSKALQETPEERERRKSVPPKWTAPPPASQMKAKVPPPVARKPSTGAPKQGTATANNIQPTQRKMSLPARTSSFDGDYGTGPKMGGAFARLQANLEKDEDKKGSSSIYSEVYEAYKIKRSLKEHGCLPTNMRNDERLRRYSLDRTAPPVVMPKPKRPSAESKRDAFGKNRSLTTPTTPTANYFADDVFSKDVFAKPTSPVLEVQENESTEPTPKQSPKKEAPKLDIEPLDLNIDKDPGEPIQTPKSPFGDPNEIKKLESSEDVQAMKAEIEQEKHKQIEDQRKLSETISELDSISFDDLNPIDTSTNKSSLDDVSENLPTDEFSPPSVTSEPVAIETQTTATDAETLSPDKEKENENENQVSDKTDNTKETDSPAGDEVSLNGNSIDDSEAVAGSENIENLKMENNIESKTVENTLIENHVESPAQITEQSDSINESETTTVNSAPLENIEDNNDTKLVTNSDDGSNILPKEEANFENVTVNNDDVKTEMNNNTEVLRMPLETAI